LILAIFASCSTTSDVVSNKIIQKRKYTKGFNIKSQNNNNHHLVFKDQTSSAFSSEESIDNNDNTNLVFASKEGVIIEQSIANQTLRTELKNLNSLLINEKKSSKANKSVNPVLLKDLKKEYKANKKEIKKSFKTIINSGKKEPVSGSEKTVAIVLLLLVGVLGIHKFYLGQIGPGILYLLTGGLCGIGLIIDLIKLLTDTYEK
ncbi:MAG: TM2 domain-containing protein, partial [Flavobacteriales bacterium]|nr:TM2 domain-containing protein [Flavobacteriales bacterium]